MKLWDEILQKNGRAQGGGQKGGRKHAARPPGPGLPRAGTRRRGGGGGGGQLAGQHPCPARATVHNHPARCLSHRLLPPALILRAHS